jgi:hypothetical protein
MDFTRCGQLESLPPSIGGLKELSFMNGSYFGMEELPEDFGNSKIY